MTFTPTSKVRLCSVPFSDYTNVLSFGNDDEARANYFINKTVYNLTSIDGYSYVKGSGAIRVNKNKESLYNVNYMMYRNDNFGNKWFYAFVDSLEYINANVTEIKFSTDVWQTWESALNFHDSFIVRQHIPKSQDTIGANTQPENMTSEKYVYERTSEKFFMNGSYNLVVQALGIPRPSYESTADKYLPMSTVLNGTLFNGCYFVYSNTVEGYKKLRELIKAFDEVNKSNSIINIYHAPSNLFFSGTGELTHLDSLLPLGYTDEDTLCSYNITSKEISIPKLEKFEISSGNYYTPKNKKLLTFPYTKLVLTNTNGSNTTYRQEWFDNGIKFNALTDINSPVTIVTYPTDYRAGNTNNSLSLKGLSTTAWESNAYLNYIAYNSNTISINQELIDKEYNYQSADLIKDYALTGITSPLTKGIDLEYNMIKNALRTSDTKRRFQASLDDKELMQNNSRGTSNSGMPLHQINKYGFHFIFMRYPYEYIKIIDNYFDKFGYAINDFKAVNYNNRSNFDYIETSQIIVDGDVPEDDMNVIKNMFNSGVRIWHNATNFLNFNVANN